MKYQILSMQVVYAQGHRDTIKLPMPIIVDNLDAFRKKKKAQLYCAAVNLTYVEINDDV